MKNLLKATTGKFESDFESFHFEFTVIEEKVFVFIQDTYTQGILEWAEENTKEEIKEKYSFLNAITPIK